MRASDTETKLESDGAYSTRTFDWTYDQLGRLTEEKLTSTIPGENYTGDYTYDLAGNRIELMAVAANGTVTETVSTYNARDELVQDVTTVGGSSMTTNDAYDPNGSLISKVTVGGDSYLYTYNVRNELATATISRAEQGHAVQIDADYKYDDAGIRVESDETTTVDGGTPTTQTTLFLIDNNNPTGYSQVLEQLSTVGGAPTISYVAGLAIISQTTASGAAQYLLADAQDSTRLVADVSGAIVARYAYDAYGSALGSSPGVVNPPATDILFGGQRFDPVLAEYYMRARYYDPTTGRFDSRDRIEGLVSQPATLNHYSFALDDPRNLSDPTGLFIGWLGKIVAAYLAKSAISGQLRLATLDLLKVATDALVGIRMDYVLRDAYVQETLHPDALEVKANSWIATSADATFHGVGYTNITPA